MINHIQKCIDFFPSPLSSTEISISLLPLLLYWYAALACAKYPLNGSVSPKMLTQNFPSIKDWQYAEKMQWYFFWHYGEWRSVILSFLAEVKCRMHPSILLYPTASTRMKHIAHLCTSSQLNNTRTLIHTVWSARSFCMFYLAQLSSIFINVHEVMYN